jgi:hypothetical protein
MGGGKTQVVEREDRGGSRRRGDLHLNDGSWAGAMCSEFVGGEDAVLVVSIVTR